MKATFRTIFLFFFIVFANFASAQSFDTFFADDLSNKDSSKLCLHIDNTNFLKNNEYFNPFVQGYTLIGYWLKANAVYNASTKLSLSGGFHAQKYSGVVGFSQFRPLFSVRFKTGQNSQLVFGNLNGTANHNIGDYLLAEEYYLTQNIESGLQFTHQSEKFKSDTWIDWKQFIFEGSLYPEILFFGCSNTIRLINKERSHLDLRLSGVASHVGGQIDCSNQNVQTIMNSQTGIDYYIFSKDKFISQIRFFGHYYTSLDQSPTKSLKYLYGYGINSGAEFSSNWIDLRLEHWYGEYFFTKFGNQMFSSFNMENPSYTEDQRTFINTHLLLKYSKPKNLKIGLGVNLYYDLYNTKLDYSMGFYLKTNFNFSLIK